MGHGRAKTHEVVRASIADAACALIGREGIDALSIRRVASESSVSPGRVQHYFPGKVELVQAAFDQVQQRVRRRVESSLSELASGGEIVAMILRAVIPSTQAEMEEARIVASFETLALTDPSLGDALRSGHDALVDLLVVILADDETYSAGSVDVEDTVLGLLAVAEGLSGQVLRSQVSADLAGRLLDEAIGRVIA